jgi:CBS domain containing-hemolysin-like protein
VSARFGVDDLAELFGIELDDRDVETVGGLLAQRLGRVPLPGAEAEVRGLRLHAEGGKDRRGRMRITTVVVQACDDAIAGRRVRVPGTDEDDDRDRSAEHA